MRSKAEAGDLVFVRLVEFAELGSEFVLADIRAIGMENVAAGFISVRGPGKCWYRGIIEHYACTREQLTAGDTHTTICFLPSSGLRMNLRVRRVT